ncbi:MAG: ABC transporter ATP-binding protein [Polyangiales bacterium]
MRAPRSLLGFVRPYRGSAALSLLTLVVAVVLDLAIPRLIQRIIDDGILRHDASVVARTALLMLAISAVTAVVAVGNNAFSVRVGEGVARDLREALFIEIQSWSFGNLDRQQTGQLMVRLTSDVSALKMLTQVTLRIGTRAPLMMLGSLALMIRTAPRLALTMLPLLAVTSAIIAVFIVKTEPLFLSVQQRLDRLNTVLQENIAGARLVKGFVREDHEAQRFEAANDDLAARSIRVMQFTSTMTPALTMCVNVGMVLVIWAGGLQAIGGTLSLGQVVAFTNYLLTTMSPLILMTLLSNTWAAGAASARRVQEVFTATPDVFDAPDATPLAADLDARVAFEDVSLTYHGEGNEPVLQGVSLDVAPGETFAILGATGAGKSSLVNLVPRFYDASSGRVLLGGRDVRAVTQSSLLSRVAVVPQETVLFTGTVRDNIRYGRPEATDDEVIAAAKAAEAHGFITELPQGYDTRVQARGANLSGGQRQRIAIARALLLDAPVLILDDSTSAVDVETETRIQEALLAMRPRRTTFVVAQRISTVLQADTIAVIDRGRVVAQGTHRELMASSPVYQEIYESQLGAHPASEALAPGRGEP